MPEKKVKKVEKEEMISFYDPAVDAYREIPISRAKKLVEVAKELDKKLTKGKE